MQGVGTLGEHFFELFGLPVGDSSWSDCRTRLPSQIFADLMQRVWRPRATHRHPDAFWRGWRLLALDGTQFSVTNTPQVRATVRKARTRRGRAAFAKLTAAVLLEVALHNPIAAAIARDGESEWALAHRLLAQLPAGALLLADRLYGCGAFAAAALAACDRVGSHFLLRARTSIKRGVIRRLRDGSRLILVPVYDRARPSHVVQWLRVREIRVRLGRRGHRAKEVRLWTSLVDARRAPALELAQLYARRWEHELYYRELKRQLRKTDVLQSHTVETGAQEIAALVLASALLAAERVRGGERPSPGAPRQLCPTADRHPCDVVDRGTGRRRVDRASDQSDREARLRSHAPLPDSCAAIAFMPTRRGPARERLATAPAARLDRRTAGVHSPVMSRALQFPKGIGAR
jgi:hypothetical protein